MVSFVVSANNPEHLAELRQCIKALGPGPELVAIKDAPSIFAAYDQGTAQAGHEVLCFVHQDVRLAWPPGKLAEIARAFADSTELGFMGVAGTQDLTESMVWFEGWQGQGIHANRLLGRVRHKEGQREREEVYGGYGEAVVLDGVLLITTKRVLRAIGGWSQDLSQGWDMYDISATLRAHLAGFYNVVIPLDILHYGLGQPRPGWYEARVRMQQIYGDRMPIHLPQADAPAARGEPPPPADLEQVRSLHQAGRLAEAKEACQRLLRARPEDVAGLNLLAMILHQSGEDQAAQDALERAAVYGPDDASNHLNLGRVQLGLGRPRAALTSFQRALQLAPSSAQVHFNLAGALKEMGRLAEAVEAYNRALELNPKYHQALNNLGNTQVGLGRLDDAEHSYCRALELRPDYHQARNNLGSLLRKRGDLAGAIAQYGRAVEARPDFAEALGNLGGALVESGDYPKAEETLKRVLELKPGEAGLWDTLGLAQRERGMLSLATASYERALSLNPRYAHAHNNLGNALKEQGRFSEAADSFRRALAIRPDYTLAHSNLLLSLNYDPAISPQDMLAQARDFEAVHARPRPAGPYANSPNPERKLRVGLVSPDLRGHPVGFFLLPVMENHRPDRLELVCYSDTKQEDGLSAQLKARATAWHDVRGMAHNELAGLIRQDGIDILLDLAGHTGQNRLPLFAHRPAPVQASWLGYFNTTGLSSLDYALMDKYSIPPGQERYFSEEVVRLPYGRFCYAPPAYAPEVGPLPAEQGGRITLGSFNNLTKLTPQVAGLWAAILKALPGSRLILKWKTLADPAECGRIRSTFAEQGLDPARVELRPHSPHARMLAEYNEIDLGLDPFPFSGGLSSVEALWMGVPLMTLPRESPISRQTLGFLSVLGLEELVANSREDYVAKAVALANDLPRLAELRAGLRQRMVASPLCDGKVFTPTWEAALRDMWRRWCKGRT